MTASIAAVPLFNYPVLKFYNLLLDPKEEHPAKLTVEDLWVR